MPPCIRAADGGNGGERQIFALRARHFRFFPYSKSFENVLSLATGVPLNGEVLLAASLSGVTALSGGLFAASLDVRTCTVKVVATS